MKFLRYTFEFSVRPITREVLVPDGIDEDSEEFEAILSKAAGQIEVDDVAEWVDAWPAEADE